MARTDFMDDYLEHYSRYDELHKPFGRVTRAEAEELLELAGKMLRCLESEIGHVQGGQYRWRALVDKGTE